MSTVSDRLKKLKPEQREALLQKMMPRIVEPYMAHIPHPKQQVFLTLNCREAMYGGAAGGGKALALDTPLLTTSGWKTMETVQVGDRLWDDQGRPTTVIWKSDVLVDRDVYRIQFSDGSSLLADADHLWSIREVGSGHRRYSARRASLRDHLPSCSDSKGACSCFDRLLTSREIAEDMDGATRTKYAVTTAQPLRRLGRKLPVDPYVFGLWLGDGDTRRGYVTIGRDDATDAIEQIKGAGYDITQLGYGDTHYRVEGLSDELRKAKAIGEYRKPIPKHIPRAFMRGSVEQRLAVVQGIVDSDGYVDDDVEVCWTSRRLTDDLMELLSSLGIKAQVHESRATLYGKDCGPRYRIKWVTELPMARLLRKLAAQKRDGFRGTHNLRYITRVDRVASVPVQCVQVSGPTRLYLAGERMIPTHNSDAVLMAALQYVDVPGYSALILRRTWPDLNAPGAILDRARTWLAGTDARQRDGGRLWEFPSGAKLSFGYMQRDQDKYKFQSAEYQFIGFDELTHFEESPYLYLFSRLRRPDLVCLNCSNAVRKYGTGWAHTGRAAGERCGNIFPDPKVIEQYPPSDRDGQTIFDIPLRMRSATNPGGIGNEWVKQRFVDPDTREPSSVFVPARLNDNPSLDRDSYRESLSHLSVVDRERLENGDWDVAESGEFFQPRQWLKFIDGPSKPERNDIRVRFWDLAGTEGGGDYTVGCLVMFRSDSSYEIQDLVRGQWSGRTIEQVVAQTAMQDGRDVIIRMEQEPGSSGKNIIDHYTRNVLYGYSFDGSRATGSKTDRAYPSAVAMEKGLVTMVTGPYMRDFINELEAFPAGAHDDQVDAFAGAFNEAAFNRRGRLLV